MGEPKNEGRLIESGDYAAKQIFAQCKILRWSHRSRFNKGVEIVKELKPKSILDYGCGDGTFLIFLKDLVEKKVGLEVDVTELATLKTRFQNEKNFEFHHVNEPITQRFDVVTCFEVLEHCTDENIRLILEKLTRLCKDNGRIILSVPKETGLTMIGKQTLRRLLGWRKFGSYEYTESYTFKEFFQMLFADRKTRINRKFFEVSFGSEKHTTCGHKGFNWKALKEIVESRLVVERVSFSPNPLPCGLLSSQVWFVCKKP